MAEDSIERRIVVLLRWRSARRERGWLGQGLLALHAALSYLFLYGPIIVLVVFSFSNSSLSGVWGGFTLDWYIKLFDNERLMEALANSLQIAGASTLISTVFGTMIAVALERYRFRFRGLIDTGLYLPIVIPDIVMAVMLLVTFSAFLNLANDTFGLRWRLGLGSVIIAHVAFSISFVTVVVRASLRNFDLRLEEAAQDLGAGPLQTFWHITLPLILPGILGGALLAFTISLDDFVISFFTTGPGASTLPIEVFSRVRRGVTPEINAVSTIMLVFSIVLVLMSQLLQRRR